MAELWYFTCEGKQMEPVTTSELKQLAGTGFLRGSDMVWQEGMSAWAKADTIPGSIPPPAPQAIKPKSDTAVLRRQLADEDEPRSRRRRRTEDDDIDRWCRREPAKGMSGLALGLIIGGVVFVVLAAVGGIVYFATRATAPVPIANYTVDLKPNSFDFRVFEFKFGTLYEFKVLSDRDTDVDLIIENAAGQAIDGDFSHGRNSFLRRSPTVTGNYRVKIANLHAQQDNRSHVTIRSIGPSRGPVGKGVPLMVAAQPPNLFPNADGPALAPGIVEFPPFGLKTTEKAGIVRPKTNWEKVVFFPEAKAVEVDVLSNNPANDVDLFIFDQDGVCFASDTFVSHTCRLTFVAQANRTYRFRISNLGPFPANCSITYTLP